MKNINNDDFYYQNNDNNNSNQNDNTQLKNFYQDHLKEFQTTV